MKGLPTHSSKPALGILCALIAIANFTATPQLHAKCTDGLVAEINNRLADLGSAPSAEKTVLQKATNVLGKATANLAAEIKALSTVATALKNVTNGAIVTAEAGTASCYFGQVTAQVNTLSNRVAALQDSGLKTAAHNQLVQAYAALNKAGTNSNVATMTGSLGVALTKVTVGNRLAAKAEFAPVSLHGKKLSVTGTNELGERFSGRLTFVDNGYVIAPSGGDNREAGTCSFQRTTIATATIVLTSHPTEDDESTTRTVNLVFTSASGGNFNGSSSDGAFGGSFRISNLKVDPAISPSSLSGKTALITITQGQRPTPFTLVFGEQQYTESAHDGQSALPGDYFFHRTAARTTLLLLNSDNGNGLQTTFLQITFSSASGGKFTFKSGDGNSGRGTFNVL